MWCWLWCMRSSRSHFIIYSKHIQKQNGCRTGILSGENFICTHCICESKILSLGRWIEKVFAVWFNHAREQREGRRFLCSSLNVHGHPTGETKMPVMAVFQMIFNGVKDDKGQWCQPGLYPVQQLRARVTASTDIINYCLPQK